MELETLKAKLIAQNQLKTELISTAAAADRVESSMREGAVAGTELAAGMSFSEDEARELAGAVGSANRELAEGAAESTVYAEGMGEVAQQQAEASASAALLQDRLERVGDEATQSAAKAQLFGRSLESVDGDGLRATLGPLSGTIASVGATAAAAAPPLFALAAGAAGLASFAGAGGAGALGLTAAGIQSRAEEMAAFSDELETAADARERLMEGFAGQLEAATDALQTPAAEQFAMRNLAATVEIAEDASAALSRAETTIYDVAGGLRSAALAASPRVWSELADQTERLAPLFSQAEGMIRDLPELVEWLGDAVAKTAPDLISLGGSAIRLGANLAEVGMVVSDIVLPPLTVALDLTNSLLGTFTALPDPIQQFVVAAGGAAAILTALSGSILVASAAGTVLGVTLGGIASTIGAPVAAAAVLIGTLAALESQFGAVTKAVEFTVGWWNAWWDAIEIITNGLYILYRNNEGLINSIIGGIGPIGRFGAWLLALEKAAKKVGGTIRWLDKNVFTPFVDTLDMVAQKLDEASDKAEKKGGISAEGVQVGREDDSTSGSGGSDDSPPTPPAAGRGSGDGVTIEELVVEDKSGNPEKTADKVIKRLRRQSGQPGG